MQTKRRILIALMLVTAMFLSVLSACTIPPYEGVSGSQTTQGTTAVSGETESEAPVELDLYNVRIRHKEVSPDNVIVHELEKRTNTILNIIVEPPEEAEQKLNIALSSGERPDIITYGTATTENNLAEADLLLPLNQYFDKMPHLEASRSKKVWDAMKHQDGNIYAIPNTTDAPATYGTIYRKDWLDKLGLEVPATLDEYYAVANAVSNQDPDGDGEKNTYAFGARGSLGSYFDHIWSAYGFLPNYWLERDGELVPGDIVPEAKEALKFCKKLFDEGIIDPEFTTDSSSRLSEKSHQGVFGAFHYGIYIIDEENIYNHYVPFKEHNPDGELVMGPLLEGPGGKFGFRQDMAIKGYIKDSIMKGTDELEACLKFMDYLASDEGVMLLNYGIEGEHYAMDSNKVVKDLVGDAEKAKYLGINEMVMVSKSTFYQTSTVFQDALSVLKAGAVPSPVDAMSLPEVDQYKGDCKDILYASFFKMIIGDIPIDGGFEDYVQQWKNAGGDEMIKAVNAEYQKNK